MNDDRISDSEREKWEEAKCNALVLFHENRAKQDKAKREADERILSNAVCLAVLIAMFSLAVALVRALVKALGSLYG